MVGVCNFGVQLILVILQFGVFTIETVARFLTTPIYALIKIAETLLEDINPQRRPTSIQVLAAPDVPEEPPAAVNHNQPSIVPVLNRPRPYICAPGIFSSRFYTVVVGKQIGVFED
jgi:hypothetical protein